MNDSHSPDPKLQLVWAVAEAEGLSHPLWQEHACVLQAEGGLGERIHSVYSALQSQHGAAALLGADSPLVFPGDILQAYRHLQDTPDDFVLGRARDGGFYFFAGTRPLLKEFWLSISYSVSSTAEELVRALSPRARIHELPMREDVDTVEDLHLLLTVSSEPLGMHGSFARTLLPAQLELVDWLKANV